MFDVFLIQKLFKIQQPRTVENEKSNKLLFVNDELKSNQYEAIHNYVNRAKLIENNCRQVDHFSVGIEQIS